MSDDDGKKPRGPRKVTVKRLENIALHYLQRFATSAENLRRVLMRRVDRSAYHHGTDRDAGRAAVDDLVVRYRKSGLLDDHANAEGRTTALRRRGVAPKTVRLRLREKGVDPDAIDAALRAAAEENPDIDLVAAIRLARRRRFGPYRLGEDRCERRDKDLAALARAGFTYDTALAVIDAETPEALEDGVQFETDIRYVRDEI